MKSALMFSAVSVTLFCGCAVPAGAPDESGNSEGTETSEVGSALNGPITCTFQTSNGHYLTAVGGGGRTTDVIHSDATRVGSWERFTGRSSR